MRDAGIFIAASLDLQKANKLQLKSLILTLFIASTKSPTVCPLQLKRKVVAPHPPLGSVGV
jgi:hypothetical protein